MTPLTGQHITVLVRTGETSFSPLAASQPPLPSIQTEDDMLSGNNIEEHSLMKKRKHSSIVIRNLDERRVATAEKTDQANKMSMLFDASGK